MYIRLLRCAGHLLQHRVWMTDIWCGQCFMTWESHAFYVMDELTIADDYSKFSSQEYYQTLLMIHLINSNREAIEVTTTTNIFGEHPCSIILIPISLPCATDWLLHKNCMLPLPFDVFPIILSYLSISDILRLRLVRAGVFIRNNWNCWR